MKKINDEMLSSEEKKEQENVQKIRPFSNPVSMSFLVFVLTNIIGGLMIMLLSKGFAWSITGLGMTTVGLMMLGAGLVYLPADKRTCMALTIWGIIIKINGKTVTVGGTTLIADYFPLYISGVKFDAQSYDKDLQIEVVTSDGRTIKPTVSVTLGVDLDDVEDFVKSGGFENIIKIIDDGIDEDAHSYASKHTAEELARKPALLAEELRDKYNQEFFFDKKMGVILEWLNVSKIELPDDLRVAMAAKSNAEAQNLGDETAYESDLRYIEKIGAMMTKEQGKPVSFDEAALQFYKLNAIRDGAYSHIGTEKGVKPTIGQLNVSSEGDKKKGTK